MLLRIFQFLKFSDSLFSEARAGSEPQASGLTSGTVAFRLVTCARIKERRLISDIRANAKETGHFEKPKHAKTGLMPSKTSNPYFHSFSPFCRRIAAKAMETERKSLFP